MLAEFPGVEIKVGPLMLLVGYQETQLFQTPSMNISTIHDIRCYNKRVVMVILISKIDDDFIMVTNFDTLISDIVKCWVFQRCLIVKCFF